jgi:PAS domain S-box-containing protein
MLSHNYFSTKDKLTSEFKTSSKEVLNRLNISITPFIESYSINEYENLILNEMSNKNIYAIIIEDYLSGVIYGEKAYITGAIRDESWNIIDYDNTKLLTKNIYLKKEVEIIKEDSELGKLKIYYSDRFLNEELNNLISRFLIVLLSVTTTLILFLYFTLRSKVISPIENIIQSISKRDKDGLPYNITNIDNNSKEINKLALTMNEMIKKVKESQQEIKELNERYELTLNAVNDGIWDWDISTDKAFFSPQWKTMLGYEDSDIKNEGKAFFELIKDSDKEKVEKALKEHLLDPENNPYSIEIQLRCKDGSYKWIHSRGKAHLNNNGKPDRMLGYHSDITHEKEVEEQLKQQEEIIEEQSRLASMGDMIGNIAHQWRQPLSIISTGATGMLMQKEFGMLEDEQFKKTCNTINDNAQYLSKTIDDFRNFIKNERKFAKFNLKENIEYFLNLVEPSFKRHNIIKILDLDDSIIIEGYPNELTQCFMNIFNNAKDALKNSAHQEKLFYISVIKEDKNIIIKFKDNAGGIPSEVLPRIFEPYFTTKHQRQGTGLGLSMTYQLITEGMNGTIVANNVTFNHEGHFYEGAEFTITIPL